MEPREELIELIEQAKEHLRYFSELGITHFGEPPLAVTSPLPISPKQEVSVSPVVTSSVKEEVEVGIKEPEVIQPTALQEAQLFETGEPMPAKKKAITKQPPALFEDITPANFEAGFKDDTLEKIREDMGECQRCKLWKTRTKLVFGEGNEKADLMFVGEAPGADEDASGRPFVGRAGQLLTKMIEAINLKREDVYIANVIKSRPPGNRNPEKDEIEACIPFLFRQIATIRPKLIVTLGNPATQSLLNTKTGISQMRGTFQDYPRLSGIKVLPTFHPAYLLRSPDKKREAWEDLKKVRKFLLDEK
ncbi:MAG TPA: uracil-DNA glycosylase [Blastocatellia bacterium]|nr:uracil-DNA glycosylase [Blastocatellia bacterium]